MKAAVITEANQICLQDADIPELKDGEALIRVKYCGICGSDIHVLKGAHPTAQFPVIPGHEFVGELVEVAGEEYRDRFRIGDTVVAQPFFSCGNCEPCAKGEDNVCRHLKFMGAHVNGGFAEYVKVAARKMYAVPDTLDLRLAALTEPLAVAVHDVRRSGLKVGESVLIIGGGPIGILIALVADHAGAGSVVISEISEFRRSFAEEMGIRTLNPLDEDFESQVAELTEGKGFDVTFEVSGSMPGITTAISDTAIFGTVVVVGMTSRPYPVALSEVFAKELSIRGVRIHNQYSFMGAVELLKSGKLNSRLEKLVSKIYPLSEVEEAFSFAQIPGDYFKILIACDKI